MVKRCEVLGHWLIELGNPIKSIRVAGNYRVGRETRNTTRNRFSKFSLVDFLL